LSLGKSLFLPYLSYCLMFHTAESAEA
jgi:hypothetical protein